MAMKLFVGNLPFSTTDADMQSLFSQCGEVTSANVIMDKFTGRSRGFGFVEMTNTDEAQVAIERFNGHEMQGRPLTVNQAKPQEPRAGGGRPGGGGGRGGFHRSGGDRDRDRDRDRRW
jgi:RNA recognition motif-containing protein